MTIQAKHAAPSDPEPGHREARAARQDLDLSDVRSPHSARNLAGRIAWALAYRLLFRPSPRPLRSWRNWLLRIFGARIDPTANVYPRTRIWAPWNLRMGRHSCLADDVDCYCVAAIDIGDHCIISQYSYLCGATHDHTLPNMPLRPMPIVIGNQVWIAADVFVGPGVTIGEGTVVGARSTVVCDLPPWKICVGNPARPIKDRVIRDAPVRS